MSGRKWITKQIAEELNDRELYFKATLNELFFYCIFLCFLTLTAMGFTSTSMYHLNKALEQQFAQGSFQLNDKTLTMYDIGSNDEFWAKSFFWTGEENNINNMEQKTLYENRLLGSVRLRQVLIYDHFGLEIRSGPEIFLVQDKNKRYYKFTTQVRVTKESCKVPEELVLFIDMCYGPYSSSNEDKSEISTNMKPQVLSPWKYKIAESTHCSSYNGKIAKYYGGGYTVDLGRKQNKSEMIIDELKKGRWLSRATRAVFFEFGVFNANLNLFAVTKLLFEFPPSGSIIATPDFQTCRLFRYISKFDYFLMGIEILIICYVIYFTLEEIREIGFFGFRILSQFWFGIEMFILLLSYMLIIVGMFRQFEMRTAVKRFLNNPDDYANFEYIANISLTYDNTLAILLIFAYIKLFKYLGFNKSMGQLNSTLKRCYSDILGFSVMFFIIFCAYAELGYLIFGAQSAGFATFGTAMFTLLRTILGDFDYMDIENANPTLAPFYFLSYIFFVFFILLNMFLAIINDTYSDVKTEIHLRPDELQMFDYLKRGFNRLLQICGCTEMATEPIGETNVYNMTIQQIRNALKKCGFSDLEVEMFFGRYNIDPTAEVGEFDINKLMADLEANIDRPKREEATTIKGTDAKPLVPMHDFVAQQERLDEVESAVGQLTNKVDALLKKLDALQQVKK